MSRKLIIVETNSRFQQQRSFYVKARLQSCQPNCTKDPQLTETIQMHIDAIINCSWIDNCAFSVTIGKAWIEDWDEIEDRINQLIIGLVGWPREDVEILNRTSDGAETTPTKTIRVATTEIEEKVHEWAGIPGSEPDTPDAQDNA